MRNLELKITTYENFDSSKKRQKIRKLGCLFIKQTLKNFLFLRRFFRRLTPSTDNFDCFFFLEQNETFDDVKERQIHETLSPRLVSSDLCLVSIHWLHTTTNKIFPWQRRPNRTLFNISTTAGPRDNNNMFFTRKERSTREIETRGILMRDITRANQAILSESLRWLL